MNIDRKSIISYACGFVLTMGAIVILVIMTAPLVSHFSSIQKSLPLFISILSLLILMPSFSRRLYRLDGFRKILGWTFIGTGMEFLAFPFSFLFVIKSASSPGVVLVVATLFASSLVFGLFAGLISIAIGILLTIGKHGRSR